MYYLFSNNLWVCVAKVIFWKPKLSCLVAIKKNAHCIQTSHCERLSCNQLNDCGTLIQNLDLDCWFHRPWRKGVAKSTEQQSPHAPHTHIYCQTRNTKQRNANFRGESVEWHQWAEHTRHKGNFWRLTFKKLLWGVFKNTYKQLIIVVANKKKECTKVISSMRLSSVFRGCNTFSENPPSY